jgi:acyl carrier protein
VFPDLPQGNIESAGPATIATWDSVATVTLFAVIEEEFGIAFDIDDLEDEISFATIFALLQQRLNQPA